MKRIGTADVTKAVQNYLLPLELLLILKCV